MPSVAIIYDQPGWSYHHKAKALKKFAPPGFSVSLAAHGRAALLSDIIADDPPDLILYQLAKPLASVRAFLDERGWSSILVGHWSRGWPCTDVGVDQIYPGCSFDDAYVVCDLLICNNEGYARQVPERSKLRVISNGVDLEVFSVQTAIEPRSQKVLWTGSELYRGMKGYDDVIVPLFAELRSRGIECDSRLVDSFGSRKYTQAEMAEWYNSGTVLVCASHAEGTPNPALEAAACGCTVVTTAVGNMPELIRPGVNGYLVERNLDSVLSGVLEACANYPALAAQMSRDIRSWHWEPKVEQYFDEFRKLL